MKIYGERYVGYIQYDNCDELRKSFREKGAEFFQPILEQLKKESSAEYYRIIMQWLDSNPARSHTELAAFLNKHQAALIAHYVKQIDMSQADIQSYSGGVDREQLLARFFAAEVNDFVETAGWHRPASAGGWVLGDGCRIFTVYDQRTPALVERFISPIYNADPLLAAIFQVLSLAESRSFGDSFGAQIFEILSAKQNSLRSKEFVTQLSAASEDLRQQWARELAFFQQIIAAMLQYISYDATSIANVMALQTESTQALLSRLLAGDASVCDPTTENQSLLVSLRGMLQELQQAALIKRMFDEWAQFLKDYANQEGRSCAGTLKELAQMVSVLTDEFLRDQLGKGDDLLRNAPSLIKRILLAALLMPRAQCTTVFRSFVQQVINAVRINDHHVGLDVYSEALLQQLESRYASDATGEVSLENIVVAFLEIHPHSLEQFISIMHRLPVDRVWNFVELFMQRQPGALKAMIATGSWLGVFLYCLPADKRADFMEKYLKDEAYWQMILQPTDVSVAFDISVALDFLDGCQHAHVSLSQIDILDHCLPGSWIRGWIDHYLQPTQEYWQQLMLKAPRNKTFFYILSRFPAAEQMDFIERSLLAPTACSLSSLVQQSPNLLFYFLTSLAAENRWQFFQKHFNHPEDLRRIISTYEQFSNVVAAFFGCGVNIILNYHGDLREKFTDWGSLENKIAMLSVNNGKGYVIFDRRGSSEVVRTYGIGELGDCAVGEDVVVLRRHLVSSAQLSSARLATYPQVTEFRRSVLQEAFVFFLYQTDFPEGHAVELIELLGWEYVCALITKVDLLEERGTLAQRLGEILRYFPNEESRVFYMQRTTQNIRDALMRCAKYDLEDRMREVDFYFCLMNCFPEGQRMSLLAQHSTLPSIRYGQPANISSIVYIRTGAQLRKILSLLPRASYREFFETYCRPLKKPKYESVLIDPTSVVADFKDLKSLLQDYFSCADQANIFNNFFCKALYLYKILPRINDVYVMEEFLFILNLVPGEQRGGFLRAMFADCGEFLRAVPQFPADQRSRLIKDYIGTLESRNQHCSNLGSMEDLCAVLDALTPAERQDFLVSYLDVLEITLLIESLVFEPTKMSYKNLCDLLERFDASPDSRKFIGDYLRVDCTGSLEDGGLWGGFPKIFVLSQAGVKPLSWVWQYLPEACCKKLIDTCFYEKDFLRRLVVDEVKFQAVLQYVPAEKKMFFFCSILSYCSQSFARYQTEFADYQTNDDPIQRVYRAVRDAVKALLKEDVGVQYIYSKLCDQHWMSFFTGIDIFECVLKLYQQQHRLRVMSFSPQQMQAMIGRDCDLLLRALYLLSAKDRLEFMHLYLHPASVLQDIIKTGAQLVTVLRTLHENDRMRFLTDTLGARPAYLQDTIKPETPQGVQTIKEIFDLIPQDMHRQLSALWSNENISAASSRFLSGASRVDASSSATPTPAGSC